MTLLAVILVLFLEQAHASPGARLLLGPVHRWAMLLEQRFNDGEQRQGLIAWLVGVALPVAVTGGLGLALSAASGLLAFLFGLAMLYLTMGFRQFSHFFTEILDALREDDLVTARQLLADWRGHAGDRLSAGEVSRLAIEEGLLASHHHVFAPLLWFALAGPAGALLYRLAWQFDQDWGARPEAEFGQFGRVARRAFRAIDWLPVRSTAFAFAIVGDFEDAIACWRTQAARWADRPSGILLASGAGALGVRLGLPVTDSLPADAEGNDRPELGTGEDADPDFMQSTIGLVWRTLVLAVFLLALVWVSGWIGG